MKPILSDNQRKLSNFIKENPCAKLSSLLSNDIKHLITSWCYYSGKIEGNTYTLVETDALLNDGITSPRGYGDAKMLKNLQNTLTQELEYINLQKNIENLQLPTILRLHRSITTELIDLSESGEIRNRPVRIGGTTYIPPKDKTQILFELNNILESQYEYDDPIERSIYLHCNIARLQPFIDGNKRVSRLCESIILMNHDIIPVYSTNDEDILSYKKAIINFYETEDYTAYANYSLNRQIAQINEIAPAKFQYNDCSRNNSIKR